MRAHWRRWAAGMLLALGVGTALAEDGVSDGAILIGQTLGLTGQIAGAAREMVAGADAYISSVNRQGGVHGRQIRVLTLDDRFDPALSAANAARLVNEERVFAIFQNRGTPHTEAILPLLAAAGIPLVAPSTGAAIFHDPVNRLIFNVRAKYQAEVAKAVEQFDTVGLRRIGILHVDDSFGRDALAGFTAAMQARRLQPALVASFDRARPQLDAAVVQAIEADPGALVIVGSATSTADLIKGIRQRGNQMQIMTLSNNSSQFFLDRLGSAGVGVIVSQITPAPELVSSALGQEFKRAAQASGAPLSYAAMEGFISAKVLVAGLLGAGPKPTRAGFIQALESIRKSDLGGVLVDYGPADHTGSEFVELSMIGRNGRLIR
ncbi:MAG: ABC transporter substrate-binding protein [Burkholderiaceae bacterium]